jgi:short-subunit dehydrogenase
MGKSALVTGASSGLGLELARLFAADGHDLVLVARRKQRLDEIARELGDKHGVTSLVVAVDLTEPTAPQTIFEATDRAGTAVEFLVNNAGFGTNGRLSELPLSRELDQVQVNVTALLHLTRLFLPAMIRRGSGRILNIGSTAGFQPGPFMATYYATKAFVNSFTEALSVELEGTGVTATLSCPGATATEFAETAGNDGSRLFKLGAASAASVARHAYDAMHAGQTVAVHGFKNKLGIQMLRVSPRATVRSIAARLNRS